MKLLFEQIPSQGLEIGLTDQTLEITAFLASIHPCLKSIGKVKANLFFTRGVKGEVHLKGSLSFYLVQSCSRCLEDFGQEITASFESLLKPADTDKIPDVAELELSAEDAGLFFCPDGIIRTEEILAEEVMAAIPVKPLCHPECRGICAGCGAELNREVCRCDRKVDPRLAVLKKLL